MLPIRWISLSAIVLVASLSPLPRRAASPAQTIDIDPRQELFVVDTRVVDDARALGVGPWSFGSLMTDLAGTNDPGTFISEWLQTWECPQVVNGVPVFDNFKAHAIATFRQRWENLDGGVLNPDLAPFRLCAIVNRPDLLKIDSGVVSSAGELRFIFCSTSATGAGQTFFVIFEFNVPASTTAEVKAYHESWHALGAYDLDDVADLASYLTDLEAITTSITAPDTSSGRLNGSNLAQLRSNEFDQTSSILSQCSTLPIINSNEWDLREWNLIEGSSGPNAASLQNVTTKQSPHIQYLGGFCQTDMFFNCLTCSDPLRPLLAEYLDDNDTDILAGNHVVPDYYAFDNVLRSFQSGHSPNDASVSPRPPCGLKELDPAGPTIWWAPGYDGLDQSGTGPWTRRQSDIRHKFALQTCAGCHNAETGNGAQPTAFSMVSTRNFGEASSLAPFLIGASVPDPVNPQVSDEPNDVVRTFNDLANRVEVLRDILEMSLSPVPAAATLQAIRDAMGTRVH